MEALTAEEEAPETSTDSSSTPLSIVGPSAPRASSRTVFGSLSALAEGPSMPSSPPPHPARSTRPSARHARGSSRRRIGCVRGFGSGIRSAERNEGGGGPDPLHHAPLDYPGPVPSGAESERRRRGAPRTILYTGKGGVGKTSVAAATARRCAA